MDGISKLPKLAGKKDYIHRRRRFHAYLRRSDFELLYFKDKPSGRVFTDEKVREWNKAIVRANNSIILTLDSVPLAQTSTIIDGEKATAKNIWTAFEEKYTNSNA